MKSRWMAFGFIAAIGLVFTVGARPWTTYSTQRALNLMLGENANTYSTQQAANILLGRKDQFAQIDTLVGHFVMQWEDNRSEVWDSSLTLFAGVNQAIALSPYSTLRNDSASNNSLARLRALVARGNWEIVSGGWTEPDSIGSNTGPLATGQFESYDAWIQHVRGGFYGIRDSLSLGTPRIHAWSQNSATQPVKRYVGELFEFATQAPQFLTGGGNRPNTSWAAHALAPSVGANVASQELAALPGYAPDRYEILQTLGDTSSLVNWKDAITRAVQTKGLCVFLGHLPTTANTSMGGGTAFRDLMTWIDTTYVQTGLLVISKPSDAFDYYYNRPISPTADFAHGNFQSFDTYDPSDDDPDADEWGSGQSIVTDVGTYMSFYPDSVFSYAMGGNSVSGSVNFGVGGKGYATLDWAGIGAQQNSWGNVAVNFPWKCLNSMFYAYVPAGAVTAKFDFRLAIDPALHTPTTGDSIGCVPGTVRLSTHDVWTAGESTVHLTGNFSGASSFINFPDGSTGASNTLRAPTWTLTAGDTLGGIWRHFQVRVQIIPGYSDIVVFPIWKEGSIPASAVCISDYHLTYQFAGPNQAMSTQHRVVP